MKLKPRARTAAPRRRHAWQILEAPAEDQYDKRNPRQQRGRKTRQRAWHILEPPTGELPAVQPPPDATIGPELPDEATLHLVLDLAVRIGEVQMASGAGASDVTATILTLTRALGLPHCEVDVIFTSITVSCLRGSDLPPVTALRVVRSRSLDYSRLSDTERLVQRLIRGRISAEDAYTELHRITTAKHPYPRWVSTLAWGGMAGFITLLLGGTGWTPVIAFVISALVDRVGRLLNKAALPFFFQQVVGGFIATISAIAIVNLDLFSLERPTLVVAAALTVLLSGLSTVSAVQDAITGYYVTAAGRSLEVALMSAGLITGVAGAISLAAKLGATHTPIPDVPGSPRSRCRSCFSRAPVPPRASHLPPTPGCARCWWRRPRARSVRAPTAPCSCSRHRRSSPPRLPRPWWGSAAASWRGDCGSPLWSSPCRGSRRCFQDSPPTEGCPNSPMAER